MSSTQAPKRRLGRLAGIGCLGLLLLVVLVVVIVVAAGGGDETADVVPEVGVSVSPEAEGDGDPLTSAEPSPSSTLGGAADDVTVTSCVGGNYDMWTAGLTIVASAEKTSTYIITVGVLAADGSRVGTLLATVEAISPGQTASVEALGTVTAGTVGATCEVVDVERFSS